MTDLESIRQTISLTALAEEAGAAFDSRLRSRCPLPRHAGDRSSRAFTIFDKGRKWKCHSSCPPEASGGDIFSFYMAWKGVDFKTTLTELSAESATPRGGISCFFRLEMPGVWPVLLLTEGEWDAMLAWEYAPDLCDAATLGGAGAKLDLLDLSLLTRYAAVVAVYDDDAAGECGRAYLSGLQQRIPRLTVVSPPAHDLTDFWRSGGDLRAWLARQVADALTGVGVLRQGCAAAEAGFTPRGVPTGCCAIAHFGQFRAGGVGRKNCFFDFWMLATSCRKDYNYKIVSNH